MADLDGKAMTAIGIGGLLVWSGVKGWSLLGTAGNLITGVKPNQVEVNPLVNAGVGVGSAAGLGALAGAASLGASASGIAGIALQYQGHAYRFGGAPGPDGSQPWDCSSFVNFVVGIKAGRAIPGYGPGKYTGTSHGPPTGTWAIWSGLTRIKRGDLAPGDIIVWLGHMGIATSPTQCISAQNPADRTRISGIDGFGPVVTYGRLK